jgi:hypothetical protein
MFIKTIHDGKKFPEKYFFFNNIMSEIRVNSEVLQQKSISVIKGYTVVMWIRVEQINLDTSNKKIIDSSMLYHINTSKFISFEVHLKNKSLYYRISVVENKPSDLDTTTTNTTTSNNNITNTGIRNSNNTNIIGNNIFHLTEIEYGKWTMLAFSHKPSSFLHKPEFTLYKDNDPPITRIIDFPNVKNQKLLSIGFCKDFTGQLSNVFMLNEAIPSGNQSVINDLKHYSFGFYNERNIRIFKDYLEKTTHSNQKSQNELQQMFDAMIFMYSPSRVRGNLCKDLVDNIDAEINTFVEGSVLSGGIAYDHNYYNNISFVGGINIFLPIFEYLSLNRFVTTSVFEEALNILCTVIDKRDVYQVSVNFFTFFLEKFKRIKIFQFFVKFSGKIRKKF